MKKPKRLIRPITIRLWPCGDAMPWIFLTIVVVLCAGKPDLIDAIVHRIMDTPKQVETE